MQESVGGGEEIHSMQYIEKTNIFNIKPAHHHANLEFTAPLLPNTTYTISKSFSPPQGNAIALHYPTNTHHILPIYYTAPSHNPCIKYYVVAHPSENNLSPTSSNSSYTAHFISKEITNNTYNVGLTA